MAKQLESRYQNGHLEDEDGGVQQRQGGLIDAIKSAILTPIRPFLSRTALRAYLTTILVVITSFVLLGCAIAAYLLFYWSYVPRIGFERTIHLQFDNVYKSHAATTRTEHPYPYGSVTLAPDLVSLQGYDVVVELVMPRTLENQEAGNFMLEVAMYAQDDSSAIGMNPLDAARVDVRPTSTEPDKAKILALSRRHAILPYRSWVVDLLHTAKTLPWYFFSLRDETEKLKVPMFEKVAFAKGSQNLPATLHLEVQSTHRLQIYHAYARFKARFTGLRWLMYNHRMITGSICITAFWVTELIFFGIAWAAVSYYLLGSPTSIETEPTGAGEDAGMIKRDEDDHDAGQPALSDTERQFPTLSGQTPLRYSSDTPKIKQEPDDEPVIPAVTPAAEADDEDEEDVDFFDSGIGTSMESSNPSRRDSMRRRRGRLSVKAEDEDKAY